MKKVGHVSYMEGWGDSLKLFVFQNTKAKGISQSLQMFLGTQGSGKVQQIAILK